MIEVNDIYYEPSSSSESLFKVKGSKHYGYVFPVKNREDIDAKLLELKKLHYASRHVCYAWSLGIDEVETKWTDDGEPHNSAGPPILGQIQSFKLHNVLIAVVRYFGGTKLGVGGLINAYKTTAKEAIENGEILTLYQTKLLRLSFPYTLMSKVMHLAKQPGVTIIRQDFTDTCILDISIRLKYLDQITQILTTLHPLTFKEN